MGARVATAAEAAAVTEVFARGFHADPVWSWAFPDDERRLAQHRRLWGLFVNSALPYGTVWIGEGDGAASLWVPPGEPDLDQRDSAAYELLLREQLGDRAEAVLELKASFADNRPSEPHHYLSLLAALPERRGRGEGTGLLDENLAWVDATGTPAYLESTNPANDGLYERRGFERVAEFSAPGDGGPVVGCMWRRARLEDC